MSLRVLPEPKKNRKKKNKKKTNKKQAFVLEIRRSTLPDDSGSRRLLVKIETPTKGIFSTGRHDFRHFCRLIRGFDTSSKLAQQFS